MGHALNSVIQDILIRTKRMQGFKTLWLPGTDHAGIATQNIVEKKLRKEGKSRFDLGKEAFIKEVWDWKNKYGDIILNQLKTIGCSCDWSRTRFTMDEGYSKSVKEAFLRYQKRGWLYKGKRVISWCPRCQTSLSDLELEYTEEKSSLWYLKYPIAGENQKYITVATTRPETMLGDLAVAVNPKDERYKDSIGKKVILPLVEKEIPIIADELIDMEFGTGAVKVTPAHDTTDYEIGQRHKLGMLQVIDERGKMINVPTGYEGLKTAEAREKVLATLQSMGLIEKIEEHTHEVPKCYRCNSSIELIPSLQWFLKMRELAKMAADPIKKGKIKFTPESFKKPYLAWLANVKDWCISRQLWWGHKIPIDGEEDVLDTWFSSALWPFAAMGWPDKTDDLKTFYPTNVLSTARDILNLWVARMVFSGVEFMDKIPFDDVIIHATVLTKDGKRMSKSLGTGINPIGLIEKYGADATRFGLAFQIMGGQDMKFVEDNILMGKKFCNKIWNASRFVLGQVGNVNFSKKDFNFNKLKLTEADKNVLQALDKIVKSVSRDIENFNFGKSAHDLYEFFWRDFCDIYIEKAKNQLSPNEVEKQDKKTQKILVYILSSALRLLHPFIPFITEEIYQQLPIQDKQTSIMIDVWPR